MAGLAAKEIIKINQRINCLFIYFVLRNSLCSTKEEDDPGETSGKQKTHESKLEVHFFSFTTLYYLVSFSVVSYCIICTCTLADYWRYVTLVVVLWRPALSSSSATVTALSDENQ